MSVGMSVGMSFTGLRAAGLRATGNGIPHGQSRVFLLGLQDYATGPRDYGTMGHGKSTQDSTQDLHRKRDSTQNPNLLFVLILFSKFFIFF